MQKEDYILREIQKIGIMLQMLIKKLVVTQEKLPSQYYSGLNDVREQLDDIGFSLDTFLQLEPNRIESYLVQFEGISGPNIEMLGDLMKEMGTGSEPYIEKSCLDKALALYELCNEKDKTYSFERENKINEIKTLLS